jgi:hypothetical protein
MGYGVKTRTGRGSLEGHSEVHPTAVACCMPCIFVSKQKKMHGIQIFALGITSVFNQILDDMDEKQREAIFTAYTKALKEDPGTYRKDAAKLTELAESCSSADDLKPDASGSEVPYHSIKGPGCCLKSALPSIISSSPFELFAWWRVV